MFTLQSGQTGNPCFCPHQYPASSPRRPLTPLEVVMNDLCCSDISTYSMYTQWCVSGHGDSALCLTQISVEQHALTQKSTPPLLVLEHCPWQCQIQQEVRERKVKKLGGHDHSPRGKDLQTWESHKRARSTNARMLHKALHKHGTNSQEISPSCTWRSSQLSRKHLTIFVLNI